MSAAAAITGTGTGGHVEHEPLEGHSSTLDVNITGVWLGMRAELPTMKQQGSGSIVNISSIDGLVGNQHNNQVRR